MSGMTESRLPPPSPILALAAAALIEMEKELPGFIERVRLRLECEANVVAAVKLRGPRSEPAVREAIEGAMQWAAMLSPIAELEAPPPKRKKWGWV